MMSIPCVSVWHDNMITFENSVSVNTSADHKVQWNLSQQNYIETKWSDEHGNVALEKKQEKA